LGSIEYAVDPGHFGTKLVVVMGHKRCGAVEAAFCQEPPEFIGTLWRLIRPAAPDGYDPTCPHPKIDPVQWDTAVRKNVENMAKSVEADLKNKPGGNGVTVVRGYYDLDSGKVELPMIAPAAK
jgi:carbonic anhydrase